MAMLLYMIQLLQGSYNSREKRRLGMSLALAGALVPAAPCGQEAGAPELVGTEL